MKREIFSRYCSATPPFLIQPEALERFGEGKDPDKEAQSQRAGLLRMWGGLSGDKPGVASKASSKAPQRALNYRNQVWFFPERPQKVM